MQSPLPEGLDETAVVEAIAPEKDVDAFHPSNVGRIMIGNFHFLPCNARRRDRTSEKCGSGNQRQKLCGDRPQQYCGKTYGNAPSP